MSSSPLFIGLDGGGTKTHVVSMDLKGTVLGESFSGSTNVNSVGRETAFNNMKEGIVVAIQKAGGSLKQVVSVCLGMSGVDSDDDKQEKIDWVTTILGHSNFIPMVENDAVIALASGVNKLHGMVVISGTGSIVTAVNNNKKFRAGGWGPLLGDQGSGFSMAQQLLIAVCHAEDGGPKTLLTELLLKEINVDNVRKVIDWTYKDVTWARFANLAKLVFQAARANDPVAITIINNNAQAILNNIKLVYRNAGFTGRVPLVLAGGNLIHDNGKGFLSQALIKSISSCADSKDKFEILFPIYSAPVAAGNLAIGQYKTSKL